MFDVRNPKEFSLTASNKRSKSRLYYFAPISTEEINRRYRKSVHVGAASHKVLGVCHALNRSGVSAVVVSSLVTDGLSGILRGNFFSYLHSSRVAYIKIFSFGKSFVQRIVSSFSFLLFSIRIVRAEDVVLLYNFFPDYILAAFYLRIIGKRAVLDIEDGPRTDEIGVRGSVNRISYFLLRHLCADRFIVSSRTLSTKFGLAPSLAVYGVADYFGDIGEFSPKFLGEKINILLGGAIMPETGWELFKDAVKHLVETAPDLPVRFFITGHFISSDILAFADDVSASSDIEINVHPDLSADQYRLILDEMDVGLCLKLPSHSIGQTTFPSKVIEYAARGLLLISTSVSDVPSIFDDDSAVLLKTEEGIECATAILQVVERRIEARRIALNGAALIAREFSSDAVGAKMREFLYG